MARHQSEIVIKATDKSKKTFDDVKRNIGTTDAKAKSGASSIGNAFKSGFGKMVAAAGGAVLALGTFKSAILGSIEAAAEHEDILLKLKTAINIAGGSYSKEAKKIEEFTNALQENSRFSNTELVTSMQSIVTISGEVQGAYEATQLAADIASTGMFDLASASRNVALALTGEVMMLGRYIPELKMTSEEMKGVTTQAGKAEVAIRVLNEKFGGAAIANLDSYSSQIAQLSNAYADLQRESGELLIPSLTSLVSVMVGVVAEHAQAVDTFGKLPTVLDKVSFAILKLSGDYELTNDHIQRLNQLAKDQERVFTDLPIPLLSTAETLNQLNSAMSEIELVPVFEELSEAIVSFKEEVEATAEPVNGLFFNIQERSAVTAEGMTEVWTAAFKNMEGVMAPVTNAINAGMMSIMNTGMTGAERLKLIFNAMAATILRMIAQIITKKIVWMATEQSLNAATVVMLSGQTVAVGTLTAAYIALAAAKRAALGPLGMFFNKGGLVPGFAGGGVVNGAGGVDNVPAYLTAGEFVINKESTDQFLPLLLALNESHGGAPRYADGGMVTNNDNRSNSRSISISIGEGSNLSSDDFIDSIIPKLEDAIERRRFDVG